MRRAGQCALLGMTLLSQGALAQVSFYTAVDMALRNSTQVRIGAAEVLHAEAAVMESVDAYKPSFSVGSSLGYSYGFPVGQPSIYSVSAQSLAYSFSQPDYIRSARSGLLATQLQLKDTRQQVILDTALDYIELTTVTQQISALDEEMEFVHKLVEIESDRVAAGVDSKVELTQARLTGAQITLHRLHLVDEADLLRGRLAHLTGLKPGDIVADAQTIPAAPRVESEEPQENFNIRAAYASAQSKLYTAFGDSKQNNRPTFAFGIEYNRYAKFNNYSEYFLRFQHNNFNVGVQITVPLFEASRTAKAKGSSAEAVAARVQADQARNEAEEGVLRLQKNIGELAAQVDVAELQNELARDELDLVTTQLRLGSGGPSTGGTGTAAPTPKDEQGARLAERNRFVDLVTTRYQLMQARLSLLRSLGQIEEWAKGQANGRP